MEGKRSTSAHGAEDLRVSHVTVRSAMRAGPLQALLVHLRLNRVTAAAIEEDRCHHVGKRGRPPRRQPTGEHAGQQAEQETQP